MSTLRKLSRKMISRVCCVAGNTANAFSISSGPCQLDASGLCVESPDFPIGYRADEVCSITVNADGLLYFAAFSTEDYDFLTVDGTQYRGRNTLSAGGAAGSISISYHGIYFVDSNVNIMSDLQISDSSGGEDTQKGGAAGSVSISYQFGEALGRITSCDNNVNRLSNIQSIDCPT